MAQPSLLEQACQALYEAGRSLTSPAQPAGRANAAAVKQGATASDAPGQSSVSLRSPALLLLVLFALLVRCGVSGGSYSGAGGGKDSPIFGDYEAQRHWMEITLNLPVHEWYQGAHEHNDLGYWGLDYPPLTAYASWLFGWLARSPYVGGLPELVALRSSRGFESPESKLFMRLTVLACDALLAIPTTILALRAIADTTTAQNAAAGAHTTSSPARTLALIFLALIQPAFILIDHGHFQYNCVSLGLVSIAVYFLWRGRVYAGSVCFVLSLTFKQMSLYYAPAFFAYLLAHTLRAKKGRRATRTTTLLRLTLLGVAVLGTFALVLSPFLTSFSALAQVFHRVFPFARGLYEDKVANFWCASSVAFKWHLLLPRDTLVRLALASTLAALFPSCLHAFMRPSRISFLYALAGSSLSFFLFSFQVHEKSFLLPLLPLVLLSPRHPLLAAWAGAIATFSMFPLLRRDGHALTYLATQALFIAASMSFAKPQQQQQRAANSTAAPSAAPLESSMLMYRMVQLSLLGGMVVHVVSDHLPARLLSRWPDLAALLFVLYSFAHFALFYLLLLHAQWSLPHDDTEDEDLQPVGKQDPRGARAEESESASKQRKEQ